MLFLDTVCSPQVNELRGQFFSALRMEAAELLAKQQAEMVGNNEITVGMARLLVFIFLFFCQSYK